MTMKLTPIKQFFGELFNKNNNNKNKNIKQN